MYITNIYKVRYAVPLKEYNNSINSVHFVPLIPGPCPAGKLMEPRRLPLWNIQTYMYICLLDILYLLDLKEENKDFREAKANKNLLSSDLFSSLPRDNCFLAELKTLADTNIWAKTDITERTIQNYFASMANG